MRAVFVVAPEDFRDEELFVTRQVLEEAGAQCVVASRTAGPCTGMHGGRALASIALDAVRVEAYDAVIFVGGQGARTYFDDAEAHRIATEADASGKVLAAICVAPTILARAGLLTGRKVTAYASELAGLGAAGAYVQHTSSVVTDGRLVTADGPRVADEFAEAILRNARRGHRSATTQSLRGPRTGGR